MTAIQLKVKKMMEEKNKAHDQKIQAIIDTQLANQEQLKHIGFNQLVEHEKLQNEKVSLKKQNFWMNALQLHIKKLVMKKMQDQQAKQMKFALEQHLNSLNEIDGHKLKIDGLIKESGVKSKQQFLIMAIKHKVQKMSENKIKNER